MAMAAAQLPFDLSSLLESGEADASNFVNGIDDVLGVLGMIDDDTCNQSTTSSNDTQIMGSCVALDASDKQDDKGCSIGALPSTEGNKPPRKRASMMTPRWSVTREQKQLLEEFFKQVPMPSRAARQALAEQMGVTCQQVKVWFRNQRQRVRLSAQDNDSVKSA